MTGYVRPDTPVHGARGRRRQHRAVAVLGRTDRRPVRHHPGHQRRHDRRRTQLLHHQPGAPVHARTTCTKGHPVLLPGPRLQRHRRLGAASRAAAAVAPARGQNVRVMTYNVLHQPAAGTKEGGDDRRVLGAAPRADDRADQAVEPRCPGPAGGQRLGRPGQGPPGGRRPGCPARWVRRRAHRDHPRPAGLDAHRPLHPVPHVDVQRRRRRRALGPRRPAGSPPTSSCRTARPGRGSWRCRCTCPRARVAPPT